MSALGCDFNRSTQPEADILTKCAVQLSVPLENDRLKEEIITVLNLKIAMPS